ncbi:hypothetical protein SCB49_07932 [unidentified eubacterium SCB49]|nr:hypothetical protein SCB49_07932 [unidentified eubacterium SCB49]
MKNLEKVFIFIILGAFLCTLLISHWFIYLCFIIIGALSIIYIFGGYQLFELSKQQKALKIIAGIILGLSLSTLLFTLTLPTRLIHKAIVLITILFSAYLIFYWLKNKTLRQKEFNKLLIRSICISCITAFFAFTPITNNSYRFVLKKLVSPETLLFSNFKMFDEIENYKTFIEDKEYDKAIIAAEKAIKHGKDWRDYDIEYYEDFSGAYEFLAEAYIKKGHKLYDEAKYNLALENYINADSVLNLEEHKPKYPEATKSDIFWNKFSILKTYNNLKDYVNYDKSIDFFIDEYSETEDSSNIDYHYIMSNVGLNYKARGYYEDALLAYQTSENILLRDSINNLDELKELYNDKFGVYYLTDSLSKAEIALNNYRLILNEKDCKYLYNYTRLLQKKDVSAALPIAKESVQCFNQEDNINNILFSNIVVSKILLELSKFEEFEEQIEITRSVALKTSNSESNIEAVNILLGYFHFLNGDYFKSKEKYGQAFTFLKSKPGSESDVMTQDVKLKIALLNKELSIDNNSEAINRDLISFLESYAYPSPSLTSFHNDLGNLNTNINIKFSDSLFKTTLDVHQNYNIIHSPKIGIAKNGLAINQLYLDNYKSSDSLFLEAIEELDYHYPENTNVNQLISQLNIAQSKFEQEEYNLSLDYLEQAKKTVKNCFKEKKTLYNSYILNTEGEILLKLKNNKINTQEKFIEALTIAKNFLDDDHPYIQNLTSKIE